ncbi:hypothetical protein GCM10011507_24340 [Edaphobacter acidisoli]|uniref:DUF4252 domain-containing protein n=1 Tax=Edaphobacter acidisoli TaxID=2040573 RepID=A0A916RVW9_9BACT|nr:DUF4252 domain-containing protein [Edaphobacter acidisoli]GGA71851.1 hypothetical protein GCM10011507_24340 [Edaphobacter acidisoli]
MNGRTRVVRTGITLAAAVLFIAAPFKAIAAPPQQKDDLFAGAEKFAKNAKSSTEVNLDKNMLGMAGKFSNDDDDGASNLTKKMDFVIVRDYEYDKPGDYNMADVEEFSKRLDGNGWSHVVKERSATESTDVCMKTDDSGTVSELVVIDAEPKELTFVHLKGHMSMSDLEKAGGKYGVRQAKKDAKVKEKVK